MSAPGLLFGAALLLAAASTSGAAGQESTDQQARNDELQQQIDELNLRLDSAQERTGLSFSYDEVSIDFKLFGNVNYGYVDPAPVRAGSELGDNAFELGVLDFFFTAEIGEHFQVLSETKAEGGGAGATLDQERLWGSYRVSDAFYAKLGLEHSEISRWNRQYHHGAWLEPTIRRPFMTRYEGDGGILPMHNSGLEIGGDFVAAAGLLHGFAVVSNGRGAVPGSKQKAEDVNDEKAVEVGIAYQPDAAPHLRFGTAVRFDDVDPLGGPALKEVIATAYIDYRPGSWETLTEVAFIHDDASGGEAYDSNSGYLQVGYRMDKWTPYARFDYKNMAEGNPFYSIDGRDLDAWDQTLGVRYDFNPYASTKLEIGVGEAETRDGGGDISTGDTFFAGIQLSWVI